MIDFEIFGHFEDALDYVFVARVDVVHLSYSSTEDVKAWYYIDFNCVDGSFALRGG